MTKRRKFEVVENRRNYVKEGQEDSTELIPGLPNDVTMQKICTKLPWQTFHSLSSVSHNWLEAIRSGQISDIRIRSRTAETLALLECHADSRGWAIALYSLRDRAVYPLPTVPPWASKANPHYSDRLRLHPCSCVAIGGKVYILGINDAEVWVLDVAGQNKWHQCASMLEIHPSTFGCTVFEGKIYVFGGCSLDRKWMDFSEVYDPKADAWTKISPMKSARMNCNTCVIGEEILVHSGYVYDATAGSDYVLRNWRPIFISRDGMEAYNPAKESWRTIPPEDFGSFAREAARDKPEVLFTAYGGLHCLSRWKIESINLVKKSVEFLHSFSIKGHRQQAFQPDAVLATKDGFLTKGNLAYRAPFRHCRIFQSSEFGVGKEEILLKEVKCSRLVKFVEESFLEPIQL